MLMWRHLRTSEPKSREKVEEATTSTKSNANNDNINHFRFFPSQSLLEPVKIMICALVPTLTKHNFDLKTTCVNNEKKETT